MINAKFHIMVAVSLCAFPFNAYSTQLHHGTSRPNNASRTLANIARDSRILEENTLIEAQKATTRWNHARELLGKYYRKSVVREGERFSSLDDVLLRMIEKGLKSKWKGKAKDISATISQESERYGFDPIFLVAVIQSESSFNPEVIGKFGEIGLMQLTPATAQWVAKKYSLPWDGPKSLKNPVTNIRLGAAYFSYLREKFDFQSRLYISAYNMGSGNVNRALEKRIIPKDYASRVMHHYVKCYAQLKEHTE